LSLLILLIVPFAGLLKARPLNTNDSKPAKISPLQALRAIRGHKGFWLLSLGFFVCGFQVVFIGTHLPAYLVDAGLSAGVGTMVLALVGLFNIFGTYIAGWLGGRWSKPRLLTALYLLRTLVIVVFLWLPLSRFTAYAFGIGMGLLWLSTVPLTNGTVATLFGVDNLSMLGGIVFLFHQLGSFLGGWLGGLLYDRTGSYDLVWQLAILLGLLATVLNAWVVEKPAAPPNTAGVLT